MKKKGIALLLMGVLCFNLMACNSSAEADIVSDETAIETNKEVENENSLKETEDEEDYSEITIKNAKFKVPNRIVETGEGLEDAARFTDTETYEVKARFCEINLLDEDIAKTAENIKNYYKEYFDVTVELDESKCVEAGEGEMVKLIYPTASYNDNNAAFAYMSNVDYNVLFYIINKDNAFSEKEVDTMLQSFSEYAGSEYSYAVDVDIVEMESIEDILADDIAAEEAAKAEEEARIAEKFNNPLCAFELTVGEEVITLPVWYSELEAAGWTFKGDATKEMAAHTSENWHEWEKDGVKLSATMSNYSVNSVPYSECLVTKIGYSLVPYNSEEDIVTLPEGIQMHKSTYEDVVKAYGEPDREGDKDDVLYMIFYKFDFEHNVNFVFHTENDVVYAVELECEEMVEGVNNEIDGTRPEILDTYMAPTELSSNPYDTTLELDGVMYQLPCPVEEFLENGWTIEEGNDYVISPGVGEKCTLVKDDVYIRGYFRCPVKDAVTADNSMVTSLEVSFYGGEKYPLSLYGGISIGEEIAEDELITLFEDMEVDADTSNKRMHFFYISSKKESETDVKYYIVLNEGVVGGIGIENNIRYER